MEQLIAASLAISSDSKANASAPSAFASAPSVPARPNSKANASAPSAPARPNSKALDEENPQPNSTSNSKTNGAVADENAESYEQIFNLLNEDCKCPEIKDGYLLTAAVRKIVKDPQGGDSARHLRHLVSKFSRQLVGRLERWGTYNVGNLETTLWAIGHTWRWMFPKATIFPAWMAKVPEKLQPFTKVNQKMETDEKDESEDEEEKETDRAGAEGAGAEAQFEPAKTYNELMTQLDATCTYDDGSSSSSTSSKQLYLVLPALRTAFHNVDDNELTSSWKSLRSRMTDTKELVLPSAKSFGYATDRVTLAWILANVLNSPPKLPWLTDMRKMVPDWVNGEHGPMVQSDGISKKRPRKPSQRLLPAGIAPAKKPGKRIDLAESDEDDEGDTNDDEDYEEEGPPSKKRLKTSRLENVPEPMDLGDELPLIPQTPKANGSAGFKDGALAPSGGTGASAPGASAPGPRIPGNWKGGKSEHKKVTMEPLPFNLGQFDKAIEMSRGIIQELGQEKPNNVPQLAWTAHQTLLAKMLDHMERQL